jgi:septum formation protein
MLVDKLKNYNIILASQSPRRIELLNGLGLKFTQAQLSDVDESYPSILFKNKIPVYIAQKKSNAYTQKLNDNDILITVDTIVWCNNQMFGKPKDRDDARRMLQAISNNVHEVLTGVYLRSSKKIQDFYVSTMVQFRELTDDEIDYYLDNYKPYDIAGAYGIMEWIGFVGLERIEGSYFNVMGLPAQRLYMELERFIE